MSEELNKGVEVSRTLVCGCEWEMGKQTKWCKAHSYPKIEQKLHKPVIETMEKMGYGLLNDGKTFYLKGMELEPRNGITFTMNQAYAIHNHLNTLISHERAEAVTGYIVWRHDRKLHPYEVDALYGEYLKSSQTTPTIEREI